MAPKQDKGKSRHGQEVFRTNLVAMGDQFYVPDPPNKE